MLASAASARRPLLHSRTTWVVSEQAGWASADKLLNWVDARTSFASLSDGKALVQVARAAPMMM
jgi:hypothetical protein